jgi:mevalonate kinase
MTRWAKAPKNFNKMNKKSGIFYAKILLFGEYSIMCDSMALSVPYTHFKGELSFISEDKYTDQVFAAESNKSLLDFYHFLKEQKDQEALLFNIDLKKFRHDIDQGLYFESTIPQGFGLGSSGALVAAVYEKYAIGRINHKSKLTKNEFEKLKNIFSQMESFFHGVSSGMDPLNCYMRNPLLIRPDHFIQPVGIPREFSKNGGIFLINTGSPGKTGPLVSKFFDWCKNEQFMNAVKNEMIPLTNASIEAILSGEIREFFRNLKTLSKFLLHNLKPMVPHAFLDIWQKGIDTGTYYLKLCGSGGGGFLLGFSENLDEARLLLQQQNVEIIPISKFH